MLFGIQSLNQIPNRKSISDMRALSCGSGEINFIGNNKASAVGESSSNGSRRAVSLSPPESAVTFTPKLFKDMDEDELNEAINRYRGFINFYTVLSIFRICFPDIFVNLYLNAIYLIAYL